ncbi:pilus assembly protein [Jannaschia sp. Os4]|uniref:TadE/TadG family type IV pilus assembly protein n=1 Tax=Jannaschia sp. Os4 TaxID=2807617 RepID=UPI00193A12C6|nr:TadE family protein [Jannaschia sp. Os4]MBM2577826.1 pilus assembly protein [Jannaschia sp. Os4]
MPIRVPHPAPRATDAAPEGRRPRLRDRLRRALRPEGGGASVEFVIVFPVFMTLFFSSFEASMLAVRHMMLERSLDITAREMRITTGANWSREVVAQRICRNARILADCQDRLVLEMTEIDRSTYNLPAADQQCVDDFTGVTPTTQWDNDTDEEMVLLRACYLVDTFFPGTGLGERLVAGNEDTDGDGVPDTDTLRMLASTVFVREPEDTPSATGTSTAPATGAAEASMEVTL